MPMYNYKCGCGEEFVRLLKLAQYRDPQTCEKCGKVAEKVIMPTSVSVDYPAYVCPVTEKLISGKREHLENLKRTGSRVLEPGEAEAVAKHRKAREEAFDKRIEATAEEFVNGLSPRKKEQLAIELDSGLDCSVTRSTVTPTN